MKRTGLLLSCLLAINSLMAQNAMGPWSNTGPVPFPVNVSGQVNGISHVSQFKFHPYNPAKIYAVSQCGGLFITNDTGHTWTPAAGSDALPTTRCSSVCIDRTNDQIIYLCLGDADYYSNNFGIYKTTNGGTTWSPANTGIGTAMAVEILMHPANNQVLVAATDNGIYRTSNGGTSWTQILGGTFKDMKAQPAANSLILYAATATTAYYSTDFGNTWIASAGITASSGNDGMRLGVSAASPATVYLAATNNNGVIWKSTNNGQSYTQVYSSSTQCLTCYDANPSSGSQLNFNIDINANPGNADEVLLVAHCVWRSIDGGVTWSKRTSWPTEMHTDMHQIEWNPYDITQRWSINDGGVWMSTDTLATQWMPRCDGVAATEIIHAGQSPQVRNLVSIGAQDNGELYFTDSTWKCNRGGDWYSHCVFDYGNTGTVYYLDKGNRRTLLPLGGDQSYNSPFAPDNASEMAFVPGVSGVAFLGKTDLWRSTNINTTTPAWTTLITGLSAIRAIEVSAADSNILFMVNASGKIYRSKNALGATPAFTIINTPGSTANTASVATVKSNPAVVFLTCGASVYRSADTGNTWTNITGTGLSGLNIRRIIHDNYSTNERLFVSEGSYVHYKNNTTTAWTNHSFNMGLPSVANVTDFMIYNDGTAASILRLSTSGRGVWQCDINDNLPPAIDFTANKQTICTGDTVHFTSTIFGNLSSVSWTFAGGTPSSSITANPTVVYNTPGIYTVTLTATGAGGSNTVTKTSYINVDYGQTATVQEGFEGNSYPPSGWTLLSESNSNWALSNGTGGYGNSSHSIVFDNYDISTNGLRDRIIAPKVDLTAATTASLSFDVAYAMWGPSQPDSLQVRISTDCGHTWNTIYSKTGTALATAPDNTTSTFVPTSSQWRTETVSLLPYTGQKAWISFDNIGHYGQAIYLDNINISFNPKVSVNNTTADATFDIFPNPSSGTVTVKATSLKDQQVLVSCYNMVGQLLHSQNISVNSSVAEATFNWKDLPRGVYNILLQTKSGTSSRRLVME
ncbi:PKD domain-containing protein [Chitinophagaceae bacterium MMS25-I14]